jgi:hypothetical protein
MSNGPEELPRSFTVRIRYGLVGGVSPKAPGHQGRRYRRERRMPCNSWSGQMIIMLP